VRAQAAILTTLNAQIKAMDKQVEAYFGQHPDAEIYLSQPGLGVVLGARVLAEFGDDKTRYADAKLAATTPAPAPSPASPARNASFWPATFATTASSTHSACKPSAP
jgi:transposase